MKATSLKVVKPDTIRLNILGGEARESKLKFTQKQGNKSNNLECIE